MNKEGDSDSDAKEGQSDDEYEKRRLAIWDPSIYEISSDEDESEPDGQLGEWVSFRLWVCVFMLDDCLLGPVVLCGRRPKVHSVLSVWGWERVTRHCAVHNDIPLKFVERVTILRGWIGRKKKCNECFSVVE